MPVPTALTVLVPAATLLVAVKIPVPTAVTVLVPAARPIDCDRPSTVLVPAAAPAPEEVVVATAASSPMVYVAQGLLLVLTGVVVLPVAPAAPKFLVAISIMLAAPRSNTSVKPVGGVLASASQSCIA